MSQIYYVVDAGVLFSPWKMDIKDSLLVTTSNIINEIRNKPSKSRTETMMILERMLTIDPVSEYITRAKDAAIRSGDISVISDNDIELVGLALMLDEEEKMVVLVSTDFAVLNITSLMGLKILDPSKKFEQEIVWGMRCPACHHQEKTLRRETECPVCGTQMRRTPLKKRRL
ncbi:MAG: hypothetical protein EAX87_10610 [Candidatus Thorarchaeota archaeon]|nr:hypothetical protein [Candidatus Thorarchaeota archaeon]